MIVGYIVRVEWGVGELKWKWRLLMKCFDFTKSKYNHLFHVITIFIIFLLKCWMINHMGCIQLSFCPKAPKLGVSKFPKLGLPRLWMPITSCADLRLKWYLKQSCSPCQKISKDMWHATCMQINQGDLWLLVVKNQIGTLIPRSFFGNNIYFKYSNGSRKPILDIYVSRSLQWYKESNEFRPLKLLFENSWIYKDSNSQSGSPFGSVWVHSFTLSYTHGSMKCDSWASLSAHTFAIHCPGHDPKVKVETLSLEFISPKFAKFPFEFYGLQIGVLLFVYFPNYVHLSFEFNSPKSIKFLL
jgi:hypothetical protein